MKRLLKNEPVLSRDLQKDTWSGTGLLSDREIRDYSTNLRRDTRRFEQTCDQLMDTYRTEGSEEAFSLLFQLNRERFRRVIQSLVRRSDGPFEIEDVVDEVFMAIWRYPHKFSAEKANAFRNWSYGIIRNTVRNLVRARRPEPVDADMYADLLSDRGTADPARLLSGQEDAQSLGESYIMMLLIYDRLYEKVLGERERRALWMVEIERMPYKEAAEKLNVTLGNLKMIVCRARRKVRAAFDRLLPQVSEETKQDGLKTAA